MEKFVFEMFERIDFYNRYKELSQRTRNNEGRFEETDKLKVLEILTKLGCSPKYVSKGQFYRIEDSNNSWDLNLHLSIKFGVVEVILGGKNNNSGLIIGGPAALICESIEYQRGIKSDEYIKKPSFSNYDILAEIFREILGIYEDFKKEILQLDKLI